MHRLRLDRPGWGAQLEKLVETGSLTLEEAAQHLLNSVQTTTKTNDDGQNDKRLRQTQSTTVTATKGAVEEPPPTDALSLGKYIGDLKHVPRTGWVRRKVPNRIESVAEHSFRAASLGMFLHDDKLDIQRVVCMTLVHDLAESIAGDIAPDQGISDEEKRKMEEDAMETIMNTLVAPDAVRFVREMWEEYEARCTPEAKAVKDLDRFEMVLQADEYEKKTPGLDLSEFFKSVDGKFTHPTVQAWFAELKERRRNRRGKD